MENASQANKVARLTKVVGTVSSASGDKTIRVVVENLVKHPQYGKYLRRHSKLAAHDEKNVAKVGDTVEIVACRRISKSKAHRFLRVVKQASIAQARSEQ